MVETLAHAILNGSPCSSKEAKQLAQALLDALRAKQTEEDPQYIIVHRPGLVPDRKGPFYTDKQIENMLRGLYEIYPDCICTVISMPHTSYPQSGREWIAMYGDKRRRPLPPYQNKQLEEVHG